MEIKLVSVVKHIKIGKVVLAKVVYEHTLGAGDSTYFYCWKFIGCHCAKKIVELVEIRLSYCKNKKGISFFRDSVVTMKY